MRRMLVGAGAVALAFGMSAGTAHAATSDWRVVQTTKLAGDDVMNDVTVAPTGSSWTVGERYTNGRQYAVVQHLIGGSWQPVKVPTWSTRLKTVDASSSKNVWAFGDDGLVVHWNGAKWTSAKFRSFRPTDAAVISASDVWAVSGGTAGHWNGKKWTSVKLPATVTAIHAVSAKNIWAAGSLGGKAAVIHWDGRSWRLSTTVALPTQGKDDASTSFNDITVSGTKVWAVGGQSWSCGEDGDNSCYQPLALRLDGTKWKSFIGPNNVGDPYRRVTADGSGGVWILHGAWDPRFVHVVGDTFTTTDAPRPAGHDINLMALANRPGAKTVWSVGGSFPEGDPPDPTGDGVYLSAG